MYVGIWTKCTASIFRVAKEGYAFCKKKLNIILGKDKKGNGTGRPVGVVMLCCVVWWGQGCNMQVNEKW
jgi:hypothetical protein